MKTKVIGFVTLAILLSAASHANEEENPNTGAEPSPPALVEFSRAGHLDATAEKRVLSWKVNEPEAIESLNIRVVKVADGTMKPTVVTESDEPSGQVDLVKLDQGPGLYAILAEVVDSKGRSTKSGMRFSYAEMNPDCPEDKAWWPGEKTVDFQTSATQSAEKFDASGNSNLVHLARQSSHVVIANVRDMIACPTKEGSLFTYVVFDRIKSLGREGNSKAPEELVLRIPGGISHGRVEIVTDAPIFQLEDQVLMFLSRDPSLHMPLVGGADGVFLIEDGERLRSYWGPNLVNVGDDFELRLDPGYQLDVAHLRHYDPNMRPVVNPLKPADGITRKAKEEQTESLDSMPLDKFLARLEKAWSIADQIGRLPREIKNEPRLPYNQLPKPEDKYSKS